MGEQTESVGELLRRHRVAAGLTQEALAERAGLSRRGIADLERGVRRAPYKHTLTQLADGLDLDSERRSALFSAGQRARTQRVSRVRTTPLAVRAQVQEPLTGFVGRQRELADVRRLLATTRLLTLIGTGGVGKTRVALKVAAQSAADYADGVTVVELAALTQADLVAHAVATRVGMTEEHTSAALVAELQSKSLLLVLDNCEHLIDACAELADTLARACPRLRILATSREPLGVEGEAIWSMPPLAIAPSEAPPDAQTGSDAVRLFIERVKAVRSDFTLDERNTPVLLDICRALEGIPLAIELAAARLRAMEPEEVRARLGQALSLLAGGSRTAPQRQRTMRATLDWSYALLSENEQHLLAELSVFHGGWDLEAVEAICGTRAPAAPGVLDLMTSLVDKSLIMVERQDGRSRYRFLEPVRQYAHEWLEARGEIQPVRRRHALHYAGVADEAALETVKRDLAVRLDRLEREHDNLRAALEWSTEHEAETGLSLAAALRWFWLLRGYVSEGRAWLRQALQAPDTASSTARAQALVAAGSLAAFQHDLVSASATLEAAQAAWREIGNPRGVAVAALNLSLAELNLGNTRRAEALLRDSIQTFRALGDETGTASCLYRLGDVAATRGHLVEAEALIKESLELGRRLGDDYRISSALSALGHLAYMRGNLQTAAAQVRESLVLSHELGYRRGIAVCIESVAMVAGIRGEHERAARLFGAAGRLRAATLAGRRAWIDTTYVRGVDSARAALGDSAYAAATAAGGALSLSGAVAEALATLEPLPA